MQNPLLSVQREYHTYYDTIVVDDVLVRNVMTIVGKNIMLKFFPKYKMLKYCTSP